jgi:hypothetical protein
LIRVIEGIVAGVAFLGAGVIIQSRGDVRNLTTGATIWMSDATELACGGGFFVAAGLLVALCLVILIEDRRVRFRTARAPFTGCFPLSIWSCNSHQKYVFSNAADTVPTPWSRLLGRRSVCSTPPFSWTGSAI